MKRRDFLKRSAGLVAAVGLAPACSDDTTAAASEPNADATDATDSAAGTDASLDGAGTGLDGTELDGANAADVPSKPVPEYSYDGPKGPDTLFVHGVASGDPLADRVILWTRVTLTDVSFEKPDSPGVFWEVARDKAFTDRVAAGTATTSADRDFCLKVDVDELHAGTDYFYRFRLFGRMSSVGRTRTAPTGAIDKLRFGVCSCALYSRGHYIGYRGLADRDDLDAVLHLGDYIYESDGAKGIRPNEPAHACFTLADYRQRYAKHRTDADLQALHARHPMIAVWDDHETANNAHKDGAPGHNETKSGPWATRRAAGTKAWHEWLPVRENAESAGKPGDLEKIWRHHSYGDLCDLLMLDTRLWGRDKQAGSSDKAAHNDPKRSIMGMDQEQWLAERIKASKARWIVIGQQVMVGPLTLGDIVFNPDQWDGYKASRARLAEAIGDSDTGKKGQVVLLTGDIHSSWANEAVLQAKGHVAGSGTAFAVEFVAAGITSGFPDDLPQDAVKAALGALKHVRWYDVNDNGYFVLTLTNERAQSDWHLIGDVTDAAQKPVFKASWYANWGKAALVESPTAAG